MRILVKADEKEYQIACPVCGAELAYKNRDIKPVSSPVQHMGIPTLAIAPAKGAVHCPECGTWVEVPAMACRRKEIRKEEDWYD